jgi:hypothetical protein
MLAMIAIGTGRAADDRRPMAELLAPAEAPAS